MVHDNGDARRDSMTICGEPEEVRDEIARQMEVSGCNYFIARFAYGDLSHAESVSSLDHFVERVMPAFADVGSRA
jgi:alkanesulfonate monooxygenase SsuD/methylene tetrahydromethanopterin reductase-like flavin-dependent oxidoreductase (luciferase family)